MTSKNEVVANALMARNSVAKLVVSLDYAGRVQYELRDIAKMLGGSMSGTDSAIFPDKDAAEEAMEQLIRYCRVPKDEVWINSKAQDAAVARNDLARLIRDMGVQAKKGNKSGALNIIKDFKGDIVAKKGQAAYDEIVRMIQDGKEIPKSLYGKFEAKASRIPKDVGIVRYDPKTDAFVDVKTGKPRSNSAAAGEAVATNADDYKTIAAETKKVFAHLTAAEDMTVANVLKAIHSDPDLSSKANEMWKHIREARKLAIYIFQY